MDGHCKFQPSSKWKDLVILPTIASKPTINGTRAKNQREEGVPLDWSWSSMGPSRSDFPKLAPLVANDPQFASARGFPAINVANVWANVKILGHDVLYDVQLGISSLFHGEFPGGFGLKQKRQPAPWRRRLRSRAHSAIQAGQWPLPGCWPMANQSKN